MLLLDPKATYGVVAAKRDLIRRQLFELMVWELWYEFLGEALRSFDQERGEYDYGHKPNFFIPGDDIPALYWSRITESDLQAARHFKQQSMNAENDELPVPFILDDDQLLLLVAEILKDELEKYDIELRWHELPTANGETWRMVCAYPKQLTNT